MLLQFKKFTCIVISISLLFMGCGAHIAQIEKPTESTEKSDWLDYYEDQFKAYGDEVEAPPGDAPNAQLQGYLEAQDSFNSAQTTGLILGLVALAIGAGSLIGTLGQL